MTIFVGAHLGRFQPPEGRRNEGGGTWKVLVSLGIHSIMYYLILYYFRLLLLYNILLSQLTVSALVGGNGGVRETELSERSI